MSIEKQVNEIYLQTLALGITEYTPSQLAVLEAIAVYCPQEGGVAVHQARGMLSMFQDVDMLDFDCTSNQQARKAQTNETTDFATTKWDIILFPNPTSRELTVQSNETLNSNETLEIFNALGQNVMQQRLTSSTTNVSIDVSKLIDGIYILRVQNGGSTITKSFVVSK